MPQVPGSLDATIDALEADHAFLLKGNVFSRGLIDTRQIVLYTSVALFCLFLTVRSLESRRWR